MNYTSTHLFILEKYCEKIRLSKGHVVFNKGDQVDFYCYIVISGKIRLLNPDLDVYNEKYEQVVSKKPVSFKKFEDSEDQEITPIQSYKKIREKLLCIQKAAKDVAI